MSDKSSINTIAACSHKTILGTDVFWDIHLVTFNGIYKNVDVELHPYN